MKKENKKSEEIIRLQKKIINIKRIETKTFKSVNKILTEPSYNNSYINNSNNNTTNNNISFVSMGNEDLINVLTEQQKQQIINDRLGSIEKLVENKPLRRYE